MGTLTVVEPSMLLRNEKLKPKLKLIQMPGTDMDMDTDHTGDTDTDLPTTTHTHMDTGVDTVVTTMDKQTVCCKQNPGFGDHKTMTININKMSNNTICALSRIMCQIQILVINIIQRFFFHFCNFNLKVQSVKRNFDFYIEI